MKIRTQGSPFAARASPTIIPDGDGIREGWEDIVADINTDPSEP